MKNTKKYTIGEIFRLGLIKNRSGEKYKDKASVSRLVSRMKFETIDTPHGKAKAVTIEEIMRYQRSATSNTQ